MTFSARSSEYGLSGLEKTDFHAGSKYYEIGHAHAHDKRVMLVRKKDTHIHFDLAHRNCPEYENITQLKELLRKRLESEDSEYNE